MNPKLGRDLVGLAVAFAWAIVALLGLIWSFKRR